MVSKRRQERLLQQVLEGRGSIKFRDFEGLLQAFGFRLERQSGSHRIYKHPRISGALNIQPLGNEAKWYQVRQALDLLRENGLLDR